MEWVIGLAEADRLEVVECDSNIPLYSQSCPYRIYYLILNVLYTHTISLDDGECDILVDRSIWRRDFGSMLPTCWRFLRVGGRMGGKREIYDLKIKIIND